jgi:nitrite reductase (NADH) small subunit
VPASEMTEGGSYVGRLADFPLNACSLVEVDGVQIGIVPTRNGVFAIANRCPHMGGGMCYGQVTGVIDGPSPEELTYDEDQMAMRCPWHGWEFLLDSGYAVGGISNRRLRRYRVEVSQDSVYVNLRSHPPEANGHPGAGRPSDPA